MSRFYKESRQAALAVKIVSDVPTVTDPLVGDANKALFTELCQSTIGVYSSIEDQGFRLAMQEVYCNSLSVAVALKQQAKDYSQYIENVTTHTIRVSNDLSLPYAVLSPDQYGDIPTVGKIISHK